MTKYASCAMLLALFLVAAQMRGDDAKDDLKKLEGTWEIASHVVGGRPDNDLKGVKIVFTGAKMSIQLPGEKEKMEASIKLDPTKKPKTIDQTMLNGPQKGKAELGIYELDGDTLKLCIESTTGEPRPTKFESKGFNVSLLTLKRVKK